MMRSRQGTTLLELLVVLLLMGLVAAMSAFGLGAAFDSPADPRAGLLARARDSALRTGQAVSVAPDSAGGVVLFLPDGRAIGAGVDPLTGAPVDAAR
jgi:Tfp pilus assembly protein FimT